MSFVKLMKYFMKKKYSNDGGSVVGVSSNATRTPTAAMCTYTASKAALEAAISVASKEGIKRRIRANAILPTCVNTEMISKLGHTDIEHINDTQPFGIIQTVQIAYLIEFLLSENASYITGAMIPVSAGVV